MTRSVRTARPDEAPALLGAYEWLFAAPGRRPASWDPVRAQAALADAAGGPGSAVLVAQAQGGAPVGLCTVYLDIHSVRFGVRAWVEDLAVHPNHRSQGTGKALLDGAKAWARERGATHLELDSATDRADAHRFYERESPDARSVSYSWAL